MTVIVVVDGHRRCNGRRVRLTFLHRVVLLLVVVSAPEVGCNLRLRRVVNVQPIDTRVHNEVERGRMRPSIGREGWTRPGGGGDLRLRTLVGGRLGVGVGRGDSGSIAVVARAVAAVDTVS